MAGSGGTGSYVLSLCVLLWIGGSGGGNKNKFGLYATTIYICFIVKWCNGSTSDFGSLSIGSNPILTSKNKTKMSNKTVSITEYAKIRGVSRQYIWKLINKGKSLPGVQSYYKVGETYILVMG